MASRSSNTFEELALADLAPRHEIAGPSYELQPFGQRVEEPPQKPTWRSIFTFVEKRHTPAGLVAVIFTIISACSKPATAIFYGKIFSSLTKFGAGTIDAQQSLHDIGKWCLALVGIGVASWAIEGVFFSSWIFFGELQARSIRSSLFAGMLKKSIEWYDTRPDGIAALLGRIQTQIRELQLAVSQPLGFLLFEVLAITISLGLGFYYSWPLTIVMLVTALVFFFLMTFVSRGLGTAVEAQKLDLTRASKYANIAITNINTVKAYNGQDQEAWQYGETIKSVGNNYLRQALVNAVQNGGIKMMVILLFVVGFSFGLFLVDRGTNSGHVLTTFYACLNALQAAEAFLPQLLTLAKGISAGETLKGVMTELRNTWSGNTFTGLSGDEQPNLSTAKIMIKHVTFAYPSNPSEKVLNDANLEFYAGETSFIVGSSGSGKSTIGNLLMNYYKPTFGGIWLDNVPLQSIDPEWLRKNITLVQQDSVLFNETILANIELGRQEFCTTNEIAQAIKTADLEQTLKNLSNGSNTVVGAGGQELSGGQQQRVAMARARVRDSPILILDEATSALDQKSREKLMAEIRIWRKDKTTIIITHDVSQILDDELVCVMQNGRLVQAGLCGKLAKKEGKPFAALLAAANSSPSITEVDPEERRASIEQAERSREPSFSRITSQLFWGQISTPFQSPSAGHGGNRLSTFEILARHPVSDNYMSSAVADYASTGVVQSSPRRKSSARDNIPPTTPTSAQFSEAFESVRRGSTSPKVSRRNFSVSSAEMPVRPEPIAYLGRSLDTAAESQQNILETKEQHVRQIVLTPQVDHGKKPASLVTIFRTIWPSLKFKDRMIFISGFVTATGAAALTSSFAYVFTQLLAVYYLPNGRNAAAKFWGLRLVIIGLLDGGATMWMRYSMEYCAQNWITALRKEAFKRIMAQPRAWFDKERNSAANLNNTLDRHAEEMRNLIGRFVAPVYMIVWTLGITLTWSLIVSWKLTLVAVFVVCLLYCVVKLYLRISSTWETRSNEAADRATNVFTEACIKIRVVRAFGLEKYFVDKHDKVVLDCFNVGWKRAFWSCLFYGTGDSFTYFLIAAIFYTGAFVITRGELSVTTCLEIVNLLMFGLASAVSSLYLIPQLSSSRSAASYVLHLANLSLSETSEFTGHRRLRTPFPVVFDNLTFTYPRQYEPVLKGISFALHPGSVTGIVGFSGSGKSTIASLLLGLYMPDEVPIDQLPPLSFAGVPIRECSLHSLRNQMAIVAQKPLLFPASILANIIYGLPEGSLYANLNSAIQAAQEAGIHDYINSLPEGYSTIIGDGGQGLSGGQAQRIAIARALVRKPRILILDEATSALDAVSAQAIRSTISDIVLRSKDSRQKAVAVVIISHSVEMMKICRHLVVLERGKVVETGTFEKLKNAGGVFADLIGVKPVRKVGDWGFHEDDDVFV